GLAGVVPAAVDGDRQKQADAQNRTAGEAGFATLARPDQLVLPAAPGQLVPVVADHGAAVEAEIVGIGAHEADGIGIARQFLEPALFDRADVSGADPELAGDVVDVLLDLLAPTAQQGADATEAAVIRHFGLARVEQIGFALRHPWSLKVSS